MENKIFALGIVFVLALTLVSAQEVSQQVSGFTAFWNNLIHSTGTFSVVGDSRSCGTAGGNADYSWVTNGGQKFMDSPGAQLCANGNSVIDIFTNGWTPFVETKNFLTYDGCSVNSAPCHVQVYCCPNPEPMNSLSCFPGTVFRTIDCNSWTGTNFYKCKNYLGVTETKIPYFYPTYNYCEPFSTKTCYYKSGTDCLTRQYDSSLFPNQCNTYTYNDGPLFNDRATCLSSICTPNNCASETCIGSTCSDGCGGLKAGTKTCGTNPPIPGCTSSGCADKSTIACNTAYTDNCGNSCGTGTKDCTFLEPIVVSNIQLPQNSVNIESPSNFQVTLKNTGTNTQTVNVEAGFYTDSYAQSIAKLYSIFPLFSTVSPIANCVPSEDFVKTNQVTLAPGESKTVSINQEPIYALVTLNIGKTYLLKDVPLVSFLGVYRTCCKKTEGFEGCAAGTGGYIDSSYSTNFQVAGYRSLGSTSITCGGEVYGKITYGLKSDSNVVISKDYNKCIGFTFYNENGTINKTATAEYLASVQGGALSKLKKASLTRDEEKLATNTALLLSACTGGSTTECLDRVNYSVSCVSLQSLRDDGTITQARQDSFMEEAKVKIGAGVKDGAIGGAIGILGCAGTLIVAGLTAPATFGASLAGGASVCSILIGGGAAIGAAVGVSFTGVDKSDPLVAALDAKDANSVGICTAEPKGFDVSSWITNLGKKFKITGNPLWDGLIIIIGGLILLMFLLNTLRGNK